MRYLTHLNLLLRIQWFYQIGSLTNTKSAVISQRRSTLFRFFGSYQHNTTCTRLCAIDSSRSSILQNNDTFNIIHGWDRCTGNTVHNPKYIVSILWALTTNHNVRRRSWVATIGRNGNTCQLSLQHAFGRSYRASSQFFSITYYTHWSRQVLLTCIRTIP